VKVLLRLLLPVLVVALAACQGPTTGGPDDGGPDDPQPLTGVITGALTDSAGAPLAGAQVTLGSAAITAASVDLAAAQLFVTNEHGQFAFDVENEGEYTITSMLDEEGAFARVTVTRDPDGNLASSPVTMQAAEFGGVAGTVQSSSAGAWAFLLGTSFMAAADDDGSFVISRVPAGDYQLAPGLLGVRGAPVPVTVEPGELTEVSEPLLFGPVITSIDPVGFMPQEDAWGPNGEEMLITIQGSGFGSSMGVSQLRYGPSSANPLVVSWTDDEIRLRMSWARDSYVITNEDLRFALSGVTGEAFSARLGSISGSVNEGDCSYGWDPEVRRIHAHAYSFGSSVRNAPVLFSVENGVLRSAPGAPGGNTFITNDAGCVEVVVEPDSPTTLLVRVGASFEGVELGEVALPTPLSLQLDEDSFLYNPADDTVELTGHLTYVASGEGVVADANLSAGVAFNYSGSFLFQAPLTLGANGRFAFSVPVEFLQDEYLDLAILYQGVALTWQYFRAEPVIHVNATTDAMNPVSTVQIPAHSHVNIAINVDAAAAAAGAALWVELDGSLPLQVEWDEVLYYSENSYQFGLSPVFPWTAAAADPLAIQVMAICRGSCVIVESDAATAFVTVWNPNYSSESVSLFAFTEAFHDLGEPSNDTRSGALTIDATSGESGALETVGDVDYFVMSGADGEEFSLLFTAPGSVHTLFTVETAAGDYKEGPLTSGASADVVAGDYIRVEASGPFAGASVSSLYFIEVLPD